jgi:predicted PurR-regulated permease PerM
MAEAPPSGTSPEDRPSAATALSALEEQVERAESPPAPGTEPIARTALRSVSARGVAKVILVAAAVIGALYLLYLIRTVLALFLVAILLAVALGPAVDFLERRRIPRGLGIILVYLSIFLAIFGVGLLVVPPIVDEIDDFTRDVPGYVREATENETIREYDERYGIVDKLESEAEKLPNRLGDAVSALEAVTVGVFSALFQLITVLVLAYFLLLDGKRIVTFVERELGPRRGPRARRIADEVYDAIGGYVVGAFTIAFLAGLTTYIVLTILGVPFAIPLAVLMAFLDLVPVIGATIGGVLIGVVAGIENFPTALIIWGIWVIAYQQFENNILLPFVHRRTVALHPLVVLAAVLIGISLLGVLGALLAIPIAGAIQVVVRDWWQHRKEGQPVLAAPDQPPPAPAE